MSSASTQHQNQNPNGAALYKGISCPISISQYMDFTSIANEMILDNMRNGMPVKTLGDVLVAQMDEWVEKLRTRVRYNEKNGNKSNMKKIVSTWIKACGVSDTDMFMQWNVNVHALLKLKRITNNEHFGVHGASQAASAQASNTKR
jgi:hypothetical protein